MTTGWRWTVAIWAFGVTLAASHVAIAQMACDPCQVGVVLDGQWERNDEVRGVFESEVIDLIGDDFDIRFPENKRLLGDFSLIGVADAVASTYVARLEVLPKPVVAIFVIDPEVQGIPTAIDAQGERISGVTNLSYVTYPSDIERNIRRLREITPFERLTLLTSEGLVQAVPELRANLLTQVESLDVEVSAASVGTSVEAAIAAIPDDTDAVYVYPLIQLPSGDLERLIQALIERRLPSFSYWGRREVEQGLLASLYASEAFNRLGRRIALNVQRILFGEDAGSLPVDFERRIRLSLNVETGAGHWCLPILERLDRGGDRR